MITRTYRMPVALALSVFVLVGALGRAQDPPPPPDPGGQPGVDVQARGPVHEAFAQPSDLQPAPGPVVTKQPPEPIEELPPDQKPEGDNVQWIPGYWAWDDGTQNFMWISGCWRDVPPGRRWLPGHWQPVDGGWVWVAGFWAPNELTQVQYLPTPPPTLDQGPSAPPPDANSIYAPGCWVYVTNRYFWRPGHWIPYQANWVWTPPCYQWTPSGSIFIDGYWDYPLDQRGLLFAPAYIDPRVFGGGGRPYVPQQVVATDFLLGALFVRSAARHYYFGDYFEPRFGKLGFVAWPDYHPVKGAYDPTFAYYHHQHAGDARWEPALRNLYKERLNGTIPRPPHSLVNQNEALRAIGANKTAENFVHKDVNLTHAQNVTALVPLNEIAKHRVTNLAPIGGAKAVGVPARALKLEQINMEAIQREQKAATVMREAAQQRRAAEAQVFTGGKVPIQHTDAPHMINLPRPPAPVAALRPPQRTAPPVVVVPKHEERPIPKFEPPHPVAPPMHPVAPPKKK
ncbi:hypothetical protein FTUN_7558 [Frigoriglobus tundricola]|uniref:Uncharacterized protein n=2 Tax=Frigoriglobus tundricola TaxID=2774151 RepID=A0A6M5Z1E5_9BACT|nr:hypothetical protein FTUN_7558 [Frigoriglobus tundricola]